MLTTTRPANVARAASACAKAAGNSLYPSCCLPSGFCTLKYSASPARTGSNPATTGVAEAGEASSCPGDSCCVASASRRFAAGGPSSAWLAQIPPVAVVDRPIRALFEDLDPELWNQCGGNPRMMLRTLEQATLDRADDGSLIRKAGIMGVVIVGGDVRPGDPIEQGDRRQGVCRRAATQGGFA